MKEEMIRLTFATDGRLNITSWNKGIAEFSGKPASEALGYRYHEVFPRICWENSDALSLAIRRKKKLSFKGYRFHCFHSYIDADVRITPVFSPKGDVRRVRVSLSVSSRCIQADGMKDDELDGEMEAIASKVAHGLRNPLNAIKGCVVYIREKFKNEESLGEFIKIMEDEIARLESFVSKTLSVSYLKRSATDVNALLKKIENVTSPHLMSKDVKSHFEYGKVPSVMVNSHYLEQAVLHVLRDSIDGVRAGGTLRIRTGVEPTRWDDGTPDDSYVVIEVSSAGSGDIVFSQESQDGDREAESRGFDLFISNEMMKNCGGHLQIQGNRYAGTTVRLLVPSAMAPEW